MTIHYVGKTSKICKAKSREKNHPKLWTLLALLHHSPGFKLRGLFHRKQMAHNIGPFFATASIYSSSPLRTFAALISYFFSAFSSVRLSNFCLKITIAIMFLYSFIVRSNNFAIPSLKSSHLPLFLLCCLLPFLLLSS